ncbi:MAG: hypothetical protein P8045_08640 [Candidatus Thiodiazotropha sp.]
MTTSLMPNMMTENVNESVEFYCNNLGFRFLAGLREGAENLDGMQEVFAADDPLQWAMLGRDEAKLMFQSQASLAQECASMQALPMSFAGTLYLEVASLDDLLSQIDKQVEVIVPDHVAFYGMRELWIRDNNGFILTLAQKAG